MSDRKTRLALTVLAVALPGPWTPVLVLAYILGRAADRDHPCAHESSDPAHSTTTLGAHLPPDPYACLPVHSPRSTYAPAQ